MAFDGIAVSNIVNELNQKILGAKIDKIYQPEADEIIIFLRNNGISYKLLLTSNASYPRLHLTNISKDNPMTAPLFCMVLRKHLTSGKITKITQPNFDRIVNIFIESFNELGDLTEKQIIIEIMGKHSNIILIDEDSTVIESAKHVTVDKSSIRPIYPGREYFLPPSNEKLNPLELGFTSFKERISKEEKIQSIIYRNYNGISPIVASEICLRSNIDENKTNLSESEIKNIFNSFSEIIQLIKNNNFKNQIVYDKNNRPKDFICFPMKIFENNKKVEFDNCSEMYEFFYGEKDLYYRINQKTLDLKKLLENNIDRCNKKSIIYQKTLKDIENKDTLKLYGELITSNIYNITSGSSEFTCENYYDENLAEITIKLDPDLSASDNAQKYFKKYNKAKRTFTALQNQIQENHEELLYLQTIITSLNSCVDEIDIKEIRDELYSEGYLKKKKNHISKKERKEKKSELLSFISSDGFEILVGKNNKQNDRLTLKIAKGNDIWMHTKNIPGSHVIIKTENKEVSGTALLEGALLAAYYSQSKEGSNVPVDYTQKKNVKKPNGAKPGMVIYETNKTIYVTPSIDLIDNIKKL